MMYSKSRRSSKSGVWWVMGVLIVIALPYFYLQYLNSPVDPNGQTQNFVVEKGQSTDQILEHLKSVGLIRSPLAFKIYLATSGMGGKLQAGDFQLSPAMDLATISQAMSKASNDTRVTLLEGWRNEEMAEKLQTEMGIPAADFLKVAKSGYMFPDTYNFKKDATAGEVAGILNQTFNAKYTDELKNKIASKGLTADQGVILASIVEREARSDEVRKNVASILLKRLKIGMVLNADATVQYALGYQLAEKSWWKRNLSLDDLKVDSPFNTYLHNGLPPSPIANPSLSSLTAVANADPSTPYLYYYHDLAGNSYYAKTLEEHEANVVAHR